MPSLNFSFRCQPAFYARFADRAGDEGISPSQLVRAAIELYLAQTQTTGADSC
jgi:hypothetical protein